MNRRALDTLLRVRHLRTEQQRAAHVRTVLESHRRQETSEQALRTLAGHTMSGSSWAADAQRAELMGVHLVAARSAAAAAAEAEHDAHALLVARRTGERVAQRLLERADLALRTASERAEQVRLDEVAVVAHSRRALAPGSGTPSRTVAATASPGGVR